MAAFADLADQIAADAGPFVDLTYDEARMIASGELIGASRDVVEGVALALYREYRPEMWSPPVRLTTRAYRRGEAA